MPTPKRDCVNKQTYSLEEDYPVEDIKSEGNIICNQPGREDSGVV